MGVEGARGAPARPGGAGRLRAARDGQPLQRPAGDASALHRGAVRAQARGDTARESGRPVQPEGPDRRGLARHARRAELPPGAGPRLGRHQGARRVGAGVEPPRGRGRAGHEGDEGLRGHVRRHAKARQGEGRGEGQGAHGPFREELKAGRLVVAQETAAVARIIDVLHLAPAQIAALTPLQIRKLCFHPRNKDGSIKVPGEAPRKERPTMPDVPPPRSLEEALARLEKYYRVLDEPEEKVEAAKAKLKAAWEKSEHARGARDTTPEAGGDG